jgi:Flp pilus assembly pilin Flp
MTFLKSLLSNRVPRTGEDGQTMAEYGVVLACIFLGVIVVLGAVGIAIEGSIQRAVDVIDPLF